MNERIKELAKQAEKYALDNVGKGHYGIEDLIYQFQFADTKMAKFAELLIQECLAIAKNREDELENAGLLEESDAVGNVAYRISRQFGVKR